MPRPIRCYGYVNQPFHEVCETLRAGSLVVFHDATTSAQTRAGEVAAGLHVKIAGFEVARNVDIVVKGFADIEKPSGKKMVVSLEWSAAEAPRLFPVMNAQLEVYPITSTETQLDFLGEYDPPMGVMGKAIDAVVGRRIAEATVHQFVSEVAAFLRSQTSLPSQEPM